MNQMITFAKIEATGNDFILIDARYFRDEIFTEERIRRMCDRHFGIGADGLILLQGLKGSCIRMQYFNADGREAAMCANGSRALILFASLLGLAKSGQDLCFEISKRQHGARINDPKDIRVELFQSGAITLPDESSLSLLPGMKILGFVNTGVPHLVIEYTENLAALDLDAFAPPLRAHRDFGPEGTNVDVVRRLAENEIEVRTFERGVEGETLSCGTGVVASALCCWQQTGRQDSPLTVRTRGGVLQVQREMERLFLTGPAKTAFIGHYQLPFENES